ncbi:hypothetical protein [Legionella sp. CNM-4043-24]|uniref:hypothetical protein n=1 Tax=Legionella sp. CNM-4043-24 TaxID=3421646 RepID=UPI00403B297C
MNKKAVVVASCLLASMPVFSKGFFNEHVMKSNHYSLKKNLENELDFSGIWVGKCDEFQDKLTLNIVQNDKYIVFKTLATDDNTGNENEDALKFPFNNVKSKNISSPNSSEHTLSSALPSGPNRMDFSYYSMGMEAADQSTSSYRTSFEFSLVLKKNGKLEFIVDQYPEDIVCVLDKQG